MSVQAEFNSIWESGSINKDWLAFVHDPLNIGLGVAVELNDVPVKSLFSFLSFKAIFKVADIRFQLLDVGGVGTGLPVVLADLISVVCDFSGVLLDLFLGPFNSLNELGKDDSCGLDSDDLVRVDVNLMGIAFVIDGWFINVPSINSVSVALWSDRSVVLISVGVAVVVGSGESNEANSSECRFHLVIEV